MTTSAEGSPWHALDADEALRRLQTSASQGLGEQEARRHLAQQGPNQLREVKTRPWWRVLLSQFQSVVVAVCVLGGLLLAQHRLGFSQAQ